MDDVADRAFRAGQVAARANAPARVHTGEDSEAREAERESSSQRQRQFHGGRLSHAGGPILVKRTTVRLSGPLRRSIADDASLRKGRRGLGRYTRGAREETAQD